MTQDLASIARDVDRLYRWRSKGGSFAAPGEPLFVVGDKVEISHATRQHVSLLALSQPTIFRECIDRLDAAYARSNASFLEHLDDAIADPTRVPSIARYWYRRGVTNEVAERMLADRKAGRPVAVPDAPAKESDIARTGAYLAYLAERIRRRDLKVCIWGAPLAAVEASRRAETDARTEAALEEDGDRLATATWA